MRADWDHYFMNIAKEVATRATCDRKHVGAVLVRDRTILSTGYNGAIKGTDHCDDVGHMLVNDPERGGPSCVRTVHAEANAIAQAAMNGVATKDSTIYTTASPCWNCFKIIANSGVKKIVFGELYRDTRITEFAFDADIELVNLSGKEEATGEVIGGSEHESHGRGGADGPTDPDCPCRGTPKQADCSKAGCGFCAAANRRFCNRHQDCALAEREAGFEADKVPNNFHCHDEDCEDCFGK